LLLGGGYTLFDPASTLNGSLLRKQGANMPDIKHMLVIDAPTETVYRAIVMQDGLAGWWTEEVKAETEVGGFAEFRFGERYYNKMKIIALEPDRRVEWECLEGDPEWVGTTFVFDLEAKENRTVLRFGHNGWGGETDFYANCNYHWGYYMTSLKRYCETGEGTPFR
jgi:uncharacterized protein YndB with AHSA1/START domain